MKSFKWHLNNILITLGIIFMSGLGTSIYFYGADILRTEKVLRERMLTEVLLNASSELRKLWHEGDISQNWKLGKFRCEDELGDPEKINVSYLRCNPNFLQCYFNNKEKIGEPHFSINFEGRSIEVNALKSFTPRPFQPSQNSYFGIISRAKDNGANLPHYGHILELAVEGYTSKSMKVILEDSCGEVFLPERVYGYGPEFPEKRSADWVWDNFNRTIFIDTHLVTFRDVAEWQAETKNAEQIEIPLDQSLRAFPATGLDLEQMKRYCSFKGKHLLEAQFFDAATFHPEDYTNPRPLRVVRGPYPWTKNRKSSFLYEARFGDDFIFDTKYCNRVFSKECLGSAEYTAYGDQSTSWVGIFQVLGGYLEAMRNPIEPEKNLKASSFYFPVNSEWHQLGKRASWDGVDSVDLNFQWLNQYEKSGELFDDPPSEKESEYKVGFRCMRFVNNES